MVIGGILSLCREQSRTGQRAFDEVASLRPPILDEGEAASSGGREHRTIRAKKIFAIVHSESILSFVFDEDSNHD
jgi:hypothetical protein